MNKKRTQKKLLSQFLHKRVFTLLSMDAVQILLLEKDEVVFTEREEAELLSYHFAPVFSIQV